jgi:hypothetical protein
MTRQDEELLDKQLRRLYHAPRNDSVLILAIVAMFLAGMALGLFMQTDERTASNDMMIAIFLPNGSGDARVPNSNSTSGIPRGDFGVVLAAVA